MKLNGGNAFSGFSGGAGVKIKTFDVGVSVAKYHPSALSFMRWLAKKENIPLIELHNMTRALYEALGVENSVKAFVHYPANTFPQQTEALADNTHFNPYGAYEIAKCVIEGMKGNHFDFVKYLLPDYKGFDPAHPDDVQEFHWDNSPFTEVEKPDGN